MTAPPPRLALRLASRVRAGRLALAPIDLELAPGEILGLLGVNGAGKSTALMLMAGVLAPTSGRVELNGTDLSEHPEAARDHIGYLPEQAPVWPELTVQEQVRAHARLRGLRASPRQVPEDDVLERLDLTSLRKRLCGVLSLGQRQRVGLACALIHNPGLLVLDEPGNGLDPVQASRLRDLLRERAANGATIVISTHLLNEVESQCTRAAILDKGSLLFDAPLLRAPDDWIVTLGDGDTERARAVLAPLSGSITMLARSQLRVRMHAGVDVDRIAPALLSAGLSLRGLAPAATPLADTFARIVGGGNQARAA